MGILLVLIGIKKCLTSEDITTHLVHKYTEPPIIIEQADPRLKAPYS